LLFFAWSVYVKRKEWNPIIDKEVDMPTGDETLRPFFLPSGLDLDNLPPQIQAALQEIVVPVYKRYVIHGASPLEVAAGTSLAFLLAQEVVAQCQLGQEMFSQTFSPEESAQRQRQIDGYYRTLGAKMGCTKFLLRLTEFRMQKYYDPILDI